MSNVQLLTYTHLIFYLWLCLLLKEKIQTVGVLGSGHLAGSIALKNLKRLLQPHLLDSVIRALPRAKAKLKAVQVL